MHRRAAPLDTDSTEPAPARPPAPRPAAPLRDRFLAFAFAAADLLLETTPDGTVNFAAGTFVARFGVDGSQFVGQPIANLFAPGERAAVTMLLAGAALRGRIPPLVLRLNDPAQTPSVIAALLMPGPPARLCFTIGALPIGSPEPALGGTAPLQDSRSFLREAEAALCSGVDRVLGLVEVKGWPATREALSNDDLRSLRDGIGAVLTAAGPGTAAGELAEGRYGVLGPGTMDLDALVHRLERLIRSGPASRHASIAETALSLRQGNIDASQAARALRYAVSRFEGGGVEAASAAGTDGGLFGIIVQAELRARTMREIIEQRRFRLQFQPVVALADLRVHHYEALLRPIPTPGSPAQSTQDFVIFAEAVGLAEELDWAVLHEVLAALRSAPKVTIAVNISGLSMQSSGFRERILGLLTGLSETQGGGRLLIELTETVEIEDMQGAAHGIAQLRAAGVPVCIDDFGAGAASFRYLREFGVDYVKIDGAYVRAAISHRRERAFITSMLELAGAVNAASVAEMVETEEQAALMRELGVKYGQGWLFGRPGVLPGARR